MDNYGQNQQQDQYCYDGNNVTPQYPQVNPHSGQYAFTMNPSLQQQSHQYQSSYSQQQSYQKKPIGLSIFNVPIFTHFNPKTAIVNLLVNGKTGDLIIQMAPAIPNNPAIGLKGPVPAGTKVITPNKPGTTITTDKPVNGLTVDEEGKLKGTPEVNDWKPKEEERTVEIPVKLKRGTEETVVKIPVTIQRDTDGDGIADSVQTPDGNVVGMEEYLANKDADGAGNGDDYYDGSGDGGFDDGNLSAIQDLMGMMDGMSDADGDGSMNGLNANDSLASRIESLLRAQPTDTDSGNGDQTASDQYLFDLAKKLLMANGMSLDDIAKGRNYDPNSAYTEPMRAWDMNRITTLLRAKKISLDGGEIRKEDAKQSISKASNRNNEISETNKANGNAVKANTSNNDVGSQTAPKASN